MRNFCASLGTYSSYSCNRGVLKKISYYLLLIKSKSRGHFQKRFIFLELLWKKSVAALYCLNCSLLCLWVQVINFLSSLVFLLGHSITKILYYFDQEVRLGHVRMKVFFYPQVSNRLLALSTLSFNFDCTLCCLSHLGMSVVLCFQNWIQCLSAWKLKSRLL